MYILASFSKVTEPFIFLPTMLKPCTNYESYSYSTSSPALSMVSILNTGPSITYVVVLHFRCILHSPND